MAKTSTHICLFFLLIILSHELNLSVEARKIRNKDLKLIGGRKEKQAKTHVSRGVASPNERGLHRGMTDELEGFVSAFRPTAPGHSPGVGHSIHN